MRKDKIPCGCCGGTGQVPLGEVYQKTLNGLRRLCRKKDGYAVANVHACWFGCSPTALSNRLRVLEYRGLATSEMHGRQKRYKVVK